MAELQLNLWYKLAHSLMESLLEKNKWTPVGNSQLRWCRISAIDRLWQVAGSDTALLWRSSARAHLRHAETQRNGWGIVLLEGRCILFLGEGNDTITSITAVDMVPRKLYNVKRGVWHSHTLNNDASVLIVENRDTAIKNSPKKLLNDNQRRRIVDITHELWQE